MPVSRPDYSSDFLQKRDYENISLEANLYKYDQRTLKLIGTNYCGCKLKKKR